MAYEFDLDCISLNSGGAIPQYSVVSVNSSGQAIVTPLAGTSVSIIGVAQNEIDAAGAAVNEAVAVAYSGVTKAICAGTVTAGAEVVVATADGRVADRGAATTKRVIGVALEGSTVAGKLVTILLNVGRAVAEGT